MKPKLQERISCNWVALKKKKRNQDGPCAPGKELWRRKGSLTQETPFTSWEISQDRRGLQRLRGECSSWTVAGKAERDQYGGSRLTPCAPQPKMYICWYMPGLGAATLVSEDRAWKRTGTGSAETARMGLVCGPSCN